MHANVANGPMSLARLIVATHGVLIVAQHRVDPAQGHRLPVRSDAGALCEVLPVLKKGEGELAHGLPRQRESQPSTYKMSSGFLLTSAFGGSLTGVLGLLRFPQRRS